METTRDPPRRPALALGPCGARYMGTLRPIFRWRTGRPAPLSARSKPKEPPRKKLTRS